MRYSIIYTAAAMATGALAIAPEPVDGMKVLWSDEFQGSGPVDQTKWSYYSGKVQNNEQQDYDNSEKYCQLSGSGSLVITPVNNGGKWSSCRIETKPAW